MRPLASHALFVSYWLACNMLPLQAQTGRYDDLAAWAARSNARGEQFVSDLKKAQSAADVASALKASARRQRESTDELIRIVGSHPELRNLPDLGLDKQALELWAEANPDAQTRRASVPHEAVVICDQMRHSNSARFATSQGQDAIKILGEYRGDPDIAAAENEARATIEDNRRRLLKLFL
jgi:hypothetical protein